MNIKKKYHYFYKITNLINNHFYYGVHNTNNLDDGYMGSGKRLHIAYKKYGIENFKKEILKYFDTKEEAFEYEAEIVNENLINNDNCYNMKLGGTGWPIYKGYVTVKDIYENTLSITKEEFNENKDKYIAIQKNMIVVKDKNNNYYSVSVDDPRYISGNLVPLWKGYKHSNETKNKISQTQKLKQNQCGKKNSQYGTCWIHIDKNNKKIKKDELEYYIKLGWIKGRKIK